MAVTSTVEMGMFGSDSEVAQLLSGGFNERWRDSHEDWRGVVDAYGRSASADSLRVAVAEMEMLLHQSDKLIHRVVYKELNCHFQAEGCTPKLWLERMLDHLMQHLSDRFDVQCRTCGAVLCNSLRWIAAGEWRLDAEDEPMTPDDTVARWRVFEEDGMEWDSLSSDDLIVQRSTLKDALEIGNRSGCCGPAGIDGPNLACKNGHVIGTEFGDCVQPHFVQLLSDRVRLAVHGGAT